MTVDPKQARAEAKADAAAAKAKAKAMRPWYRKKRFVLPLALVALIVVISVASGGGDDSTTSNSNSGGGDAPAATSSENTYSVGETTRSSDFEMTVHEVQDPYVSTNEFATPSDGNRYVAVEVEVTNRGDERQPMSTLLGAEVMDSMNRPYSITFAGGDLPQLDGEVVPGQSRRGWVVFEVPADAEGLKLRLKGSLTAQGSLYVL